MAKIHNHSEQFDGHFHSVCGHNGATVSNKEFEATNPVLRCKICERDWFPNGQPDWHYQAAKFSFSKESVEEGAQPVATIETQSHVSV